VTDYLRGTVGYQGAVLSDDLEMGAVAEACPIGEATVRAAAAGHDLLLICHTEQAQRAAAKALVDAYHSGALPRAGLETAVERVRRLRQAHATRAEGGFPGPEPDGAPLAMAMATRAVTVLAPGPPDFNRRLNGQVVVVFPRLSELAARITIEPEVADEKGYLQRAFAPSGIEPEVVLVGMEPGPEDIAEAAARAARADAAILFLYDAHLFRTHRMLLEAVQAQAQALAVVLLRNPYDAALLRPGVLGVTAWGFRRCQLDAVIARLTYPQPPRA
jgi:beta-N-acetylhexosaminidase